VPVNTQDIQKLRELCREASTLRDAIRDFCLHNINGIQEETDRQIIAQSKESMFEIYSNLHNVLLSEVFPTPK
jgi:hypothetical protein